MAQDSFDAIVNAVMQAESGGRRYDKQGNLLTSSKGAKGEMQVLDKTKFNPGFGVEPAKANTPDERARVGRDYLKAMVDRYGELDKALAAYNWGPGNTDKWIAAGADPKKLPSETRSYIDKIKSSLSPEQMALKREEAKPSVPEAAPMPATAAGAPQRAPVRPPPVARTADLGANYQAALALSYLADEADREEKGREYDDREPSTAQKWLASATPKVSPEMLAMPYASPFGPEPEQQPVRAAQGGFIAVGYGDVPGFEDGGEVTPVASKQETQEPPRRTEFRVPTGQAEARLREFNRLDPVSQQAITDEDARVQFALTRAKPSVSVPYTLSTIPGARALYDETLALESKKDTSGYMVPPLRERTPSGRTVATQDVVFLQPGRTAAQELQTRAHEAEHLLAKRGLGRPSVINAKFDELMGDSRARRRFVEEAVKMQPYLEKTYGTESAYFRPNMLAYQDRAGAGQNLLFEQFAELAAIEQATGKDLTKDPELRKTIFKDKKVREVYNALTGLRQTRLDARDLAPYTPIPEKEPSMMEFIRGKLGFAEGGEAKSEDKPEARASARGMLESLRSGEGAQAFFRGLTMLPQNIVGAPVDLATLAMRPFGYSVEKPVGGSEWLKEKSRAAGVAFQEPTDPNARALFTAGDIASNLINPAGATRAAVRGVKEVGEQAGQAAKMLRELKPPSGPDLAPAGVPAEMARAPKKEKTLEELVSAPMEAAGSRRDWERISNGMREEVKAGQPVSLPKEDLMKYVQPIKPVSDGLQWVKITNPVGLVLEGGAMNHSINRYASKGNYSHGGLEAIQQGRAEVFSLRDPSTGRPVVTMDVEVFPNGDRRITQIKGPSNSDPSRFRQQIFEFMDDPKMRVVYADSNFYKNTPTEGTLPKEYNIYWQSEFDDWKLGLLDYRRKLAED